MVIYEVTLESIAGKTIDLHALKNNGNDYVIIRDRDLNPISPEQRRSVSTLSRLPDYVKDQKV